MAKLRVWNPWSLNDPFNRMFDEMTKNMSVLSDDETFTNTAINLWEEGDNYHAEISIPGMKPEDLNVSIEDRYLIISGETNSEREDEDKNKKYYMKEISRSSFSRTILLPGNVDAENIEAKYENGMLKLVIPKQVKSSAKKISIK